MLLIHPSIDPVIVSFKFLSSLFAKLKKEKLIKKEKKRDEYKIALLDLTKEKQKIDKDVKFKITSKISDRGIWLPSSVTLKENDIEYVCKKIKNFFA